MIAETYDLVDLREGDSYEFSTTFEVKLPWYLRWIKVPTLVQVCRITVFEGAAVLAPSSEQYRT